MAHNVTSDSYLVPAGFVAVVRDVDCFYSGGIGSYTQLENPANGIFVFFSFPASVDGALQSWRGRQVFLPGEAFALASTDGVDIQVSGYLLAAP